MTLRVAVITPYSHESIEVLAQCHESVLKQTYPCSHFLVSDNSPLDEVRSWKAGHFQLPFRHHDNGNTPRCIGSLSAMRSGFDAVAYLDADNWYYPRHVENLIQLHQATRAPVCAGTRDFYRLDGTFMYSEPSPEGGIQHVDTSCFLVTSEASELFPLWSMMPRELSPICDRVFWSAIRARGIPAAHSQEPTVAFRTRYRVHYEQLGETPPPEAKSNSELTGPAVEWWDRLPEPVRQRWIRYLGTPLG